MRRSNRNQGFWVAVGPNKGWEYALVLGSVGLAAAQMVAFFRPREVAEA